MMIFDDCLWGSFWNGTASIALLWCIWSSNTAFKGCGPCIETHLQWYISVLPSSINSLLRAFSHYMTACSCTIQKMVFRVWCVRTWLVCTAPWPQPHSASLGWTTVTASQASSYVYTDSSDVGKNPVPSFNPAESRPQQINMCSLCKKAEPGSNGKMLRCLIKYVQERTIVVE